MVPVDMQSLALAKKAETVIWPLRRAGRLGKRPILRVDFLIIAPGTRGSELDFSLGAMWRNASICI